MRGGPGGHEGRPFPLKVASWGTAHDRCTWRSGVRSAMRAASQLSGRGPTDVDVAPVNQKSDYDNMILAKFIVANNKDPYHSAQMHMLICIFVISQIPHMRRFSYFFVLITCQTYFCI